ncbi:hypothetical protein [Desulfovibrio sp. JC010]|uniref:hypothetical protein n=1 Tax=Desulfovibrio sp. JC010 TaxID=2593641 RepID=UPI0013D31354|nr:hypothetical protein [Desulfovibrio sp. JC010]NDV27381.1 hypothetical protein [Desulfovibrio sp. JC010]
MSFDFRIGADAQQSYATSTAQTAAAEKTEITSTRLTMGNKDDGDTVTISQQGKELATSLKSGTGATDKSSETDSESSSSIEQQIEKVKEQIEKIKEEIEKLQKDPEKNKDQIAAKQNELLQYQGQLTELQSQLNKANGTSGSGGTRAEGMKNSLT